MIKAILLVASLFAATAQAPTLKDSDPLRAKARVESYAPQQLNLVYELYRNGQKLGQVTDTFIRNGSHYTLTSETRASGPLKMLWPGTIRLESTGDVTPAGLRPTQFQHARSDAPHKLATARLDWKQGSIAWQYKGKSWQANDLQPGAQDQLSQLYQFMFAPSLPTDFMATSSSIGPVIPSARKFTVTEPISIIWKRRTGGGSWLEPVFRSSRASIFRGNLESGASSMCLCRMEKRWCMANRSKATSFPFSDLNRVSALFPTCATLS